MALRRHADMSNGLRPFGLILGFDSSAFRSRSSCVLAGDKTCCFSIMGLGSTNMGLGSTNIGLDSTNIGPVSVVLGSVGSVGPKLARIRPN